MNQQPTGLAGKNFRLPGFLFRAFVNSNRLIIIVLFWILASENIAAKHVSGLTGFYRNGQVFLTWSNVSNVNSFYKVYRSVSPIVTASQLSTCEYLGWTNQYSAKDHDLTYHYGTSLYLRIDSAGTPLPSTKGLFVATTLAGGSYYYAVTIILNGVEDKSVIVGVTALLNALSEQVSKPQPVFQQIVNVNNVSVEHWCCFISFKRSVTRAPDNASGFMASAFLVYKNNNTGNQPLSLQMHSGSGDVFTNITRVTSNEMNLNVEQRFPGGDDGNFWGANSNFNIYQQAITVPDSGTNHNFFQELYENILEWAILNLNIDSNRIYLTGSSTGGCGAFAFAMTYPEKIAAVSLGLPCFNTGFQNDSASTNRLNSGGISRTKEDKLLGLQSTNLPSNTGINTFDMLNGAWMVHHYAERDYPFIYATSGKNDIVVGWTEKPIYYDSVNANNTGGYYFWDNRDHSGANSFWISKNFDLFRFRRNVSYPAFANCSLNENYGNGNKDNGASRGSVNGMLDWTDDIVDSDFLWKLNFFIRDLSGNSNQKVVYPDSATTDITLRRIQQFHVPIGATVNWQVNHNNQIVQSGSFLFTGGIITVHGVKAYKDTAQFQLSYWPPDVFNADNDQDGFGDPNVSVYSDSIPYGYVANNGDCNDNNAAVHPDALDICNSIDDNCDGEVDDNAITATVTPTGSVNICSGISIILTANAGSGISYQWIKDNSNITGATNRTYTTNIAGTYKVAESNSFTCSSTSSSVTTSLLAGPAAIITPLGNLDICAAGSVNLQANSGTGLTYQWKKGGTNISGATNQIYTAITTGTYKIVVSMSNGCIKSSTGTTVTKSCRESSNTESAIPTLSVYPNPSNGRFMIDLSFSVDEDQTATIQLMNMIGQIIYEQKIIVMNRVFQQEIQLNDGTDGLYMVKVFVNDKVYTKQLLISKQ